MNGLHQMLLQQFTWPQQHQQPMKPTKPQVVSGNEFFILGVCGNKELSIWWEKTVKPRRPTVEFADQGHWLTPPKSKPKPKPNMLRRLPLPEWQATRKVSSLQGLPKPLAWSLRNRFKVLQVCTLYWSRTEILLGCQ